MDKWSKILSLTMVDKHSADAGIRKEIDRSIEIGIVLLLEDEVLEDDTLFIQQPRLFEFQSFTLCDKSTPVSEEIAVSAEYGFEVFCVLIFDEAVYGSHPIQREAERHLPEQFCERKIFVEHHHVVPEIEEGLGRVALW